MLPAISKALERLMKRQMNEFLEEHRLLNRFQSGFRASHGTATALLKITHDIRTYLDKGLATVLLLLDFSKAFDTVRHNLLLGKLATEFRFSTSAVGMVRSYLIGRKQKVVASGCHSKFLDVVTGLPQGSVLGPLLFSIFINDLPRVVKHSHVHLFADDVQLYRPIRKNCYQEDMSKLSRDLNSISYWAGANGLLLNAQKTLAIRFSSSKWPIDFPKLRLNGVTIEYADAVKDLGVMIDNQLNWRSHAQYVSAKVFAGLRCLWPHSNYLPRHTKLLLVKSLLLPHFSYCSQVLGKLQVSTREILLKAFKACVRFVCGLGRYESTLNDINVLLGCDLFSYFDHLSCVLLHKIVLSKQPDYLCDFLTPTSNERTFNLLLPIVGSDVLSRSLFVSGVSIYNSLPPLVKRNSSLTGFKIACRNYFSV